MERICSHAAAGRASLGLITDLFRQRPDLICDSATAITTVLVSAMRTFTETTALARLLTLVVSRKTSVAFSNHAPTILLAHVRAVCTTVQPLAGRLELEPGIFALCEAIARGKNRDRQGEGIAGIGLGEGPFGEAEAEVWARLWNNYRRKTYAGRG